jgi:drug/metabolite transporter (DMT)-like permease
MTRTPPEPPTAPSADPAAPRGRTLAVAARSQLLLSMVLVGSYVALSKPLVGVVPPFVLGGLRFAIAAVLMLPWTLPRTGDAVLTCTERALVFAQSFFGNFLFTVCMLYGVSCTSATSAGVILAALPATVMVGSRVFLGERLGTEALAAGALVTAGILLLRLDAGAGGAGSDDGVGDLLVFGSVCCEAVYVIIGKRLAARVDPMRLSAWINLCGLLLTAPLALVQWPAFDPGRLSAATWGLLVYYATAASVLSVWLWMRGLRGVPAHEAAVYTAGLPLSATAVGVVFLGEPATVPRLVAVALAVAGIALAARGGRRATAGVC